MRFTPTTYTLNNFKPVFPISREVLRLADENIEIFTSGFGSILLALELCADGCIMGALGTRSTWKEILLLDMLVPLVEN